jgi:hypothetical protein
MYFCLWVFGQQIFAFSTTPIPDKTLPSLEATSGGQFEMGFNAPYKTEVMCQEGKR